MHLDTNIPSKMSSADTVHYSADPVHRGIESIVNKNSDLVQTQVNDFKARLKEMAMFLADVEKADLVSHGSTTWAAGAYVWRS